MEQSNLVAFGTVAAAAALSSAAVTYAIVKYNGDTRSTRTPNESMTIQYENPAYCDSPDKLASTSTNSNSCEGGRSGRRADPYDPRPRSDYLSWDDYFMAVAYLSSQRSKDPNKQVGACIVDQNNVICGIGYNGFPRGCPDSKLPWAKLSRNGSKLDTKYPYVCHAEMNAILNKNGASVVGSKVYVTMFPCNECAKLMIQAGIAEIIFHEDKAQPKAETPGTGKFRLADQYAASKKLLALAGVKIRQHMFKRPIRLLLTNDIGLHHIGHKMPQESSADDLLDDCSGVPLVTRFDS
ncbi:hypothetical protein M9435_004258 [Picochlorum sp. BPE23]|nr:hypothetical protein M9435_004258 [Picochlorum sp. BPE23]